MEGLGSDVIVKYVDGQGKLDLRVGRLALSHNCRETMEHVALVGRCAFATQGCIEFMRTCEVLKGMHPSYHVRPCRLFR
jgi:hypothetical protein